MRTFEKQTHAEFRKRIKRVDPSFYRWGERGNARDATVKRPFASLLGGFIGAYVIVSVSNNRDYLESSLMQGSLDGQLQEKIMMALAALVAISFILVGVHVFRFLVLRRGGKKSNSGALLTGVLGALMLIYTPASVWQTGFGMMDDTSRSLMLAASDATGVDFGKAVFVSSLGR